MGKIIGNGCSRDCGTVRIYMKNQRKVFQSLTLILQFGLNMIVPIVMCTLLGAWLGKKYGMPIITVPLFIMGALAGFNNIFKMAKKIYGQGNEGKRDHVEKTKLCIARSCSGNYCIWGGGFSGGNLVRAGQAAIYYRTCHRHCPCLRDGGQYGGGSAGRG